jgi:hypothetical protein
MRRILACGAAASKAGLARSRAGEKGLEAVGERLKVFFVLENVARDRNKSTGRRKRAGKATLSSITISHAGKVKMKNVGRKCVWHRLISNLRATAQAAAATRLGGHAGMATPAALLPAEARHSTGLLSTAPRGPPQPRSWLPAVAATRLGGHAGMANCLHTLRLLWTRSPPPQVVPVPPFQSPRPLQSPRSFSPPPRGHFQSPQPPSTPPVPLPLPRPPPFCIGGKAYATLTHYNLQGSPE